MLVYVLDKDGKPLMPTKNGGKVRRLLKEKKARIARREPFVIQLLYETTHYVQEVTLGVDTGARHIGLSATTEKEELYAEEGQPRGKEISKELTKRSECRRGRRHRKVRHREARFNNRTRSKKEGWLPPSTQATLDCHVHLINKIASFLPIAKVNIEVGKFDMQKLQADAEELARPRSKGYQEGPQLGYENVKAYVKARDGYECQHCHGKSGDKRLEVHHIKHRSQGGSDAPENLITLCSECHSAYHKGKLKNFNFKPKKGWCETARVNIIGKRLPEVLEKLGYSVGARYGYETTAVRYELGLEKSHVNDAFIIAGNLDAARCEVVRVCRKVRCHNRSLHKMNPRRGDGVRRANQCAHTVKGYRLFDVVLLDGVECYISGKRSTGRFHVKSFDGNISTDVIYKKLKRVLPASGWLIERRRAV